MARSLEQGLHQLRDSPQIKDLFVERFLGAYAAVKAHEFEAFNQLIGTWEREHPLQV